jgi:thymidylate synthase (FAD)
MKARVIAYTKPTEEFLKESNVKTIEELVAYCARVSNPNNQTNTDTMPKLLRYLINNRHFSPFEMVNVTMEIETTRDIARQLLRHRSFTFQEFSQRYADPTKDLEFELRETRLQDKKNRQNSVVCEDEDLKKRWEGKQQEVINTTQVFYEWAVANGIAKEQARSILPEGNIKSRLYMNGSLRSYIHYLDVRLDESTQKEHRELAREIQQSLLTIVSNELLN